MKFDLNLKKYNKALKVSWKLHKFNRLIGRLSAVAEPALSEGVGIVEFSPITTERSALLSTRKA